MGKKVTLLLCVIVACLALVAAQEDSAAPDAGPEVPFAEPHQENENDDIKPDEEYLVEDQNDENVPEKDDPVLHPEHFEPQEASEGGGESPLFQTYFDEIDRQNPPKFDRPKDDDNDERSPAINGLGKKHAGPVLKAEQGSATTSSRSSLPAWAIALIVVGAVVVAVLVAAAIVLLLKKKHAREAVQGQEFRLMTNDD